MMRVSQYNSFKSLFMLAIVLWLLSFQTLHRLSHEHDHDAHHSHQHVSDWGSISEGVIIDSECQICDLISLPFTYSESWTSCSSFIFQESRKGSFIASCSYVADVLFSQHRGPPAIA